MTNTTKLYKSRFIFAVDIDNTSGDYTEATRQYFGERFGIPVEERLEKFPAPIDYDLSKSGWHGLPDLKTFLDYHSDGVAAGMFATMKPYDHVPEVLHRLHDQGIHIRVITSRFLRKGDHDIVKRTTSEFFERNNIPYDDFIITDHKADIMADLYVDDSPKNIQNLREASRNVVIYDQPYNRNIAGARTDNWLDLEQRVLSMARMSGFLD